MKTNQKIKTLILTGVIATSVVAIPGFTIKNSYNKEVEQSYSLEGDEMVVGKGEKYTTISDALKNVKAGDIIVVKGGTYNEQITMTKSGTASAYITIKAYPGETPILDGEGLDTIVDFNGQDYINFEGFKVQNITGKQWSSGIYLGGGEKYINLRNLEITGIINPKPTSDNYGANPILLYGEKTESIEYVTIENCYVHDNVTGWCEAIAVSGNCENIQVLNNRVDNNGNIGIDFCGNFGYCSDSSLDQPRNCVARGNVISNCNSPYATSYGLYADGARDIVFENNIIYNSQGGIEIGAEEKTSNLVGNIVVKNNLVYGCSENGITVGGYETGLGNVDNVEILHNTVVNNNCELTLSKCSNITIQDNIFKGNNLMYSEMSSSYTKNIIFNNNVYDGDGFMLANKSYNALNWKSSIDKNAIIQSVKLNGDYVLQENIKATDGTLIGYVVNQQSIMPPADDKEENENNKPNEEEPTVPPVEEEPIIPPIIEEEEEDKPIIPPIIEDEEEQPTVPPVEIPDVEEPEENKSILPVFKRGVWHLDRNVSDVKYLNDNSIQFKAKKAWEGVWLEDTSVLKQNGEIVISVDNISKNTEVQIYVNGREVAVLNNKTKTKTIKIDSKTRLIDFCIVSSKTNTTVKVEGLKIVKK